jgi:hypothetical protein
VHRINSGKKLKVLSPRRVVLLNFPSEQLCTLSTLPLTHITFGDDFDHHIDNLPLSLSHLTLGNNFNHPVDHLPPSLLHLTIGLNFTQPIDHLPPQLTSLTFTMRKEFDESHFNLPVDHLPPSLTQLHFAKVFNQAVDHLPPALTHLLVVRSFNKPVDHLPQSLTHLAFERINLAHKPDRVDIRLNRKFRVIMSEVREFHRNWYNIRQPIDHLPPALTHLTFITIAPFLLIYLPLASPI